MRTYNKAADCLEWASKKGNKKMPSLHSDINRMARRGLDCATIAIRTGCRMSVVSSIIQMYETKLNALPEVPDAVQ
jgi:hypothetical protein